MRPNAPFATVQLLALALWLLPQFAVGQQGANPYVSIVGRESRTHAIISSGSVRRAVADVALLMETARQSSVADNTQFDHAAVLARSGYRSSAIRSFDPLVTERSTSPFAPFARVEQGLLALEASAYSEAVALLIDGSSRALLAAQSRSDSSYRSLAHVATFWEGAARAALGQHQESITAFTQCVAIDSSGPYAGWAYYALGQVLERNGDVPAAISAFQRASRVRPLDPVALGARTRQAVGHVSLRQPQRALDVLTDIDSLFLQVPATDTTGVAGSQTVEEVALVRAEALTLMGSYQSAFAQCESFLTRFPRSSYRWHVELHAGYTSMNLGEYRRAGTYYARILDSVVDDASPIRQQALFYRALVLAREGTSSEARAAFQSLSVQSGYPFQAHALVELGQIAYQQGAFDDARTVLEKAERVSPDAVVTLRAQVLLGATFIEQQQWSKAASVYERAQKIAEEATEQMIPERLALLAEIRLKRGISLVQSTQIRPAITALTEYLGNHPNDGRRDEGTFWLAEAMYRADLLKNAQELYEEVARRFTGSPRREEALYGLAWTYFRRRDFERSTATFGELLRTYPSSKYATEALARRGDGLFISRQFAAAAQQYSLAAESAPGTDDGQYAAYQAGQASYRAGDHVGAVKDLRAFIQRYPKSRLADDALFLIGWIAFEDRNDLLALEEFQRLLTAYPDGDMSVRALYTSGVAQFNLRQLDVALATFRGVVSRYPSHALATEAAKKMQTILLGQGRTQEALDVADSLMLANPQSIAAEDFAFKKAEIFYSGQNFSNAATELESFMKKYPSSERNDEALYLLGQTYLSINDEVQALAAFRRIETSYPRSPFRVQAYLELADHYRNHANSLAADSMYAIVWRDMPSDSDAVSQAGYSRAIIAYERGDTVRSLELFRETADRYAGREYAEQARYQVATLYRRGIDIDSATYHLGILATREDRPHLVANALYDLGLIYKSLRRYDAAVNVLERLRNDFAGYEDAYSKGLLELGECYEKVKRIDDAIQVYGVVRDLRPDDFGKTAVSRIQRLRKVRR